MVSFKKTLFLLVLCLGLNACEQREPIAKVEALSAEQQAQLEQLRQQALLLQQLQLQQQIYAQTFNTMNAHQQQIDQQLKIFSATQACAIAGNCRLETRIVPPP
jgi:hypothetical protein